MNKTAELRKLVKQALIPLGSSGAVQIGSSNARSVSTGLKSPGQLYENLVSKMMAANPSLRRAPGGRATISGPSSKYDGPGYPQVNWNPKMPTGSDIITGRPNAARDRVSPFWKDYSVESGYDMLSHLGAGPGSGAGWEHGPSGYGGVPSPDEYAGYTQGVGKPYGGASGFGTDWASWTAPENWGSVGIEGVPGESDADVAKPKGNGKNEPTPAAP